MNDELNKEDNPGYRTPDGYFDSLSNRIRGKVERHAELADFPNLQKLEKRLPFIIPEGYFGGNVSKLRTVIHQVKETKRGTVIKAPWLFSRRRLLRAAAAAAVFGIFYAVYKYSSTEEIDCNTLACLERSEVMRSSLIDNVSEDEIFEMVDLDRLNERLNRNTQEPEMKNRDN